MCVTSADRSPQMSDNARTPASMSSRRVRDAPGFPSVPFPRTQHASVDVVAVSCPRRTRNACHQQLPTPRAQNTPQLVVFVVPLHARVVRVVRHPARHPGAQHAAPRVLLLVGPREASAQARSWRSARGSRGARLCRRAAWKSIAVQKSAARRSTLRPLPRCADARTPGRAPGRRRVAAIMRCRHFQHTSQGQGGSLRALNIPPRRPKG